MDGRKISLQLRKYRYVLIVALAGIIFMLLPETAPAATEEPVVQHEETEDMEARLERILSRIDGAGEVAVMLTESAGEEIVYQCDADGADTVLISDAQRNEQGLIRSREPPVYRGAIVVCAGADSSAVRLALVEAVANVTGLGTDKITVLKMK